MSDVMQFVRELLEGQPPTMSVRGTVTHVIAIQPETKDVPFAFLLQVEIGGSLYSDFALSRELEEILVGDEILLARPTPSMEGYPYFLAALKAPASVPVRVNGEEDPSKIPAESLAGQGKSPELDVEGAQPSPVGGPPKVKNDPPKPEGEEKPDTPFNADAKDSAKSGEAA